jgi:hypothetical protein
MALRWLRLVVLVGCLQPGDANSDDPDCCGFDVPNTCLER